MASMVLVFACQFYYASKGATLQPGYMEIMILILLDLVEATGDPKYIPLLEEWVAVDSKKVRVRIGEVIQSLTK